MNNDVIENSFIDLSFYHEISFCSADGVHDEDPL